MTLTFRLDFLFFVRVTADKTRNKLQLTQSVNDALTILLITHSHPSLKNWMLSAYGPVTKINGDALKLAWWGLHIYGICQMNWVWIRWTFFGELFTVIWNVWFAFVPYETLRWYAFPWQTFFYLFNFWRVLTFEFFGIKLNYIFWCGGPQNKNFLIL